MRTLEWNPNSDCLKMIDQRRLPARLEIVECCDAHQVATAIHDMTVRGAPAIGVAAGYGMALAALRAGASSREALLDKLDEAARELRASRPTAVNLGWAVDRMLACARTQAGTVEEIQAALVEEAGRMADEDVEVNKRLSRYGAELIQEGDTIIHHCNTGALAVVDWGTALGVIRMAHEQGKHLHVLVDETRPRLQGARLTAWELSQYRIPYDIISDNAAGYFLRSGQVQKVLYGADRVAANGDVANKIGSYMLALAANDNDVPVYSVFPISTVDLSLPDGDAIPIEERSAAEVLNIQIAGEPATPSGATARNPAFDITPHRLLTGLITDRGVIYPPFSVNLPKAIQSDLSTTQE